MYLGFLVTYKCNADPRQNALIRLEDVRRDLISLKSNWPVGTVCFSGGEPLLYFELLTNLVREVKVQGITCAILTNAFWGENQSIARKYVGGLKDAGLDEMHISVDAFHQEFVPIDAVKGVIRASREAGIGHIAINAKSLGAPDMDNPYNRQTKRLMEELSEEFDFDGIGFRPLWPLGRAADTLVEYFPATKVSMGSRCRRYESLGIGFGFIPLTPQGKAKSFSHLCPNLQSNKPEDLGAYYRFHQQEKKKKRDVKHRMILIDNDYYFSDPWRKVAQLGNLPETIIQAFK